MALWKQPGRSADLLAALERDVAAGLLTEDLIDRSVARVLASKGVDPCLGGLDG